MTTILFALGLIGSVFLTAFFAGMETALYRVSRVRLRIKAERGDHRSGMIRRLLLDMAGMVTVTLIGGNLTVYLGTYILTSRLLQSGAPQAEALSTLILTPILFVLAESLPKQLAYSHPDRFAAVSTMAMVFSKWLFTPPTWLLNRTAELLRRLFIPTRRLDIGLSRRDRLIEHFEAGVAENVLKPEQHRMAMRILELESVTARDLMIPVAKVLLLPAAETVHSAVKRITAHRMRMAIITSPSGEPVAKVVSLAILIRGQARPEDKVGEAAISIAIVNANAVLPDVLAIFRRRHAQRTLVASGGKIIGLLSSEAILGRIAGLSAGERPDTIAWTRGESGVRRTRYAPRGMET